MPIEMLIELSTEMSTEMPIELSTKMSTEMSAKMLIEIPIEISTEMSTTELSVHRVCKGNCSPGQDTEQNNRTSRGSKGVSLLYNSKLTTTGLYLEIGRAHV